MKFFRVQLFKEYKRKKEKDFKQEIRMQIGKEQFQKLLKRGLSFPVALR